MPNDIQNYLISAAATENTRLIVRETQALLERMNNTAQNNGLLQLAPRALLMLRGHHLAPRAPDDIPLTMDFATWSKGQKK